ncbi:TIGR04282 family arsenosugar biosynthesis glycosyltransferase [Marinobacterium jannaschii]|uniref:TIGR04282 family arsenosugar biosynthesis glycosyltransferase n=1 Tax=Marinobacterium jannaschii TaxID=64970 RepID=UPI000484B40B|nr:TIGR04282 family arsenosugar biosynthesis glycosyltransferase [Marinobacterium jannaschii]
MTEKTTRIVIFAKAPRAGFAKTRLIPAVGAEGAAELAKKLLLNAVDAALAADIGPVELCVTPDLSDPLWQQLDLPQQLHYSVQCDGDLGQRMAGAVQKVLAYGEQIILTGTDCPMLNVQRLRDAAAALNHHRCALYPVSDGGYSMIALNDFDPSLFSDIPWSTEQVFPMTQERLENLGWDWWQGETLRDIDEPEDLQWLPNKRSTE